MNIILTYNQQKQTLESLLKNLTDGNFQENLGPVSKIALGDIPTHGSTTTGELGSFAVLYIVCVETWSEWNDYSTPGTDANEAYCAMTANIEKHYALGVVLIASEVGYRYFTPWYVFGKNFWDDTRDSIKKKNISDLILLVRKFDRFKLLDKLHAGSAEFKTKSTAIALFHDIAKRGLQEDVGQAYSSVETVFGNGDSPELHQKTLMLITFREALKVARRMSVYTLEGEEFDATVIVSADPDAHDQKDELISELDYGDFYLDNSGSVRDLLEACQGRGLYLVIDSLTGKMLSINKHPDTRPGAKGFRIHIKSNARVDVWHGGEILLLWDGFEWAFPKTAVLKTLIKNNDAIKDLVSACDSLLSKRKSAIIILLDENDRQSLDNVTANVLRPLLYGTTAYYHGGNVKDLVKNDSLAALLGLDGAHVIDMQTGNVQWLCMRLASGDDDVVIKTENVNKGDIDRFTQLISGCKVEGESLIILGLHQKEVFQQIVGYLKEQDNSITSQLMRHMSLQQRDRKLLLRFRCMAKDLYEDSVNQWSVRRDDSGSYWFEGNIEKIEAILTAVRQYPLISLYSALREWVRNRTIPTRENEGTGTRSAKFVSKKLPASLVVKISASNSVKVYQNGSQLEG
jgi:hypothetical protein